MKLTHLCAAGYGPSAMLKHCMENKTMAAMAEQLNKAGAAPSAAPSAAEVAKTIAAVAADSKLKELSRNLLDYLSIDQQVALAAKWDALKEAERDSLSKDIDGALPESPALKYMLFDALKTANAAIFSAKRGEYLSKIHHWMHYLLSKEDVLREAAQKVILGIENETTGAQRLTLLSAVKAELLRHRTFMKESDEKDFAELCRTWGIIAGTVK